MKTFAPLLLAILIGSACREYATCPTPSKATLAIEFPARGTEAVWKFPVPDNGESGTEQSADPLPGTTPAPLTLSLAFSSNGTRITAEAYAIGPETDPLRYSDGHKKVLGHYSALPNQLIELNELKKLGYQPITLRVVPFTPPQTAHPALSSKAPSIQIAITEAGPPLNMSDDAPSCNVVLHNLSSKGVTAYLISGGGESFDPCGRSIIDPGKDSRPIGITFGRSSRMTPQGWVDNPPKPQQVIVEAVLFTDGSFEGKSSVAAHLKSRQIENLAIYRLVTPAIDRIVADSSLNDDQRVARIKDEIYKISSQPDQPTL